MTGNWLDAYFDAIDDPEELPTIVVPENGGTVPIAGESPARRVHLPIWLDDYFGPAVIIRDGIAYPKSPELEFAGDGIEVAYDGTKKRVVVTWTGGAAGTPGSVWREGSGVPSNTLGIDGDFYLRTTTGDVYQRSAGAYAIVANIKGADGDPGADGDDGIPKHIASAGTVSTPDRDTLNFSADFTVTDNATDGRKDVALAIPATTITAPSGLLFVFPRLGTISSTIAQGPHASGVWTKIGGDPATLYTVTLRIRGVFETPIAPPGGTLITTGVNNGVARVTKGGAPDTTWYTNTSNRYRLEVEDPAEYYWINVKNGADNANAIQYVDQTIAIQMYGQSGLRLAAYSDYEDSKLLSGGGAGTQQRNDSGSGNTPVSLPYTTGLSSIVATQPYDGQFCQIDVVSVV